MSVHSSVINELYSKRLVRLDMPKIHPNEFIVVKDENDENQQVFGMYDEDLGGIRNG